MYVKHNIFVNMGQNIMKKQILIFLLAMILFLSGFLVNASYENVGTIEKTIKNIQPIIIDEGQYIKVDLSVTSFPTNKPGEPMVPVINQVFILPFGSKISSVEVSYSEFKKIKLTREIKPFPEPTLLDNLVKTEETIKDSEIYNSIDLYPPNDFVFNIGAGLHDLEHVNYLYVQCYPVKYSPQENILYYSEVINIKITYKDSSNSFFTNDEYDLVIISPSKFSNNLLPLIDHKNSYGVRTLYMTTQEIYDNYQGRDKPEMIKYFIRDAIESWNAKYVLLVGDVDTLPIRYTKVDMFGIGILPTDLYYADIFDDNGSFCSWDSNNNDVFGEYDRHGNNIDNMDLYADINVGRIPCSHKFDLKTVVGKIINYETKTYGQDWFNNAIFIGGDTFPGDTLYEGEIVLDEVSEQIPEFEHIKLFTSKGNYNPMNINKVISNGAGFVSYSGHGYSYGFGTSPPNEEKRIEYFTPYSFGMLNNNKFPVIFFDACCTATLDFNVAGIKLPCFAWYLIKKPVGGAIATIGATRVAFTMVNVHGANGGAGYMNVHFFKAYEPGVTVSHMLVSAQNDYLNNHPWIDFLTLEEFVLLGDPSLKIGGYSY